MIRWEDLLNIHEQPDIGRKMFNSIRVFYYLIGAAYNQASGRLFPFSNVPDDIIIKLLYAVRHKKTAEDIEVLIPVREEWALRKRKRKNRLLF